MGERFDPIVLGGGPAGYVGAIRAAQLGARVALVDRGRLGGTCCNRGCIPTKALLQSAQVLETVARAAEFGVRVEGSIGLDLKAVHRRKDRIVQRLTDGIAGLIAAHQVNLVRAKGRLIGPGRVAAGDQELEAATVLIATGAEPAPYQGRALPSDRLLDSTTALDLIEPPRSIAIVGGGYVGVEFAGIFRAYGTAVTLIEAQPQILPGIDRELSRVVVRRLEGSGLSIRTGTMVSAMQTGEQGVEIALQSGGEPEPLLVEKVLWAVDRQPNTAGLGLEALGVNLRNGYVVVDEDGCTNLPWLRAAGDVTGPPLLAHRAAAQAASAVESIFGHPPSHDLSLVPSCVYTDPEIAVVGLTEEEAKRKGIACRVGRFGFAVNGRALTLGAEEGLVKAVVAEADDAILGIHMVGPHASALISEAVVAMSMEATFHDLVAAIHPHPTLSEALPEALLDAVGRAIHKARRPRTAGAVAG